MSVDSTDFHIGEEPQIFVDNWNIESVNGVTRRWHKPARRGDGPVLKKDRPWELFPYFTYSNYNVLRDPEDGLFKCWYEDACMTEVGVWPHTNRLLYAESRDGVHWEKPEFDNVLHEGRSTNIVAGHDFGHGSSEANPWPEGGVHSQAIIIDPDPPTPAERFRMFFSLNEAKGSGFTRRVTCAHSADGIRWIPYPEAPNMGRADWVGDVSTLWYDADCRQFVMNTRKACLQIAATPTHFRGADPGHPTTRWTRPYAPHRPDLMNKRRVYQTRSHDFIHWSEPVEILCPDDDVDNLDDMYYGMGQFQVGRMHFGTLGIFRQADNERDVRLVFSRDGLRWRNADRGNPFLAPRGPGHWDAHMVSIVPEPLEVGDELWFYHGSCSGHHDYCMSGEENLDHPEARDLDATRFAMGLATLRRDGFCSLDTGDVRPGFIATRPMCGPNTSIRYGAGPGESALLVNARCRDGGSIRATVTDRNGRTLEGFEIEKCDAFTGDSLSHTFTWQGRGQVPGTNAFRRVVFHLVKAEIFSFRLIATGAERNEAEKIHLF